MKLLLIISLTSLLVSVSIADEQADGVFFDVIDCLGCN